jgi:hypothetical protein
MKLGIRHTQPKPPKAVITPVRRDRGIAVEDVMPQLRPLTAAPSTPTVAADGSTGSPEEPATFDPLTTGSLNGVPYGRG